jgi:hypothetical protein
VRRLGLGQGRRVSKAAGGAGGGAMVESLASRFDQIQIGPHALDLWSYH